MPNSVERVTRWWEGKGGRKGMRWDEVWREYAFALIKPSTKHSGYVPWASLCHCVDPIGGDMCQVYVLWVWLTDWLIDCVWEIGARFTSYNFDRPGTLTFSPLSAKTPPVLRFVLRTDLVINTRALIFNIISQRPAARCCCCCHSNGQRRAYRLR